MLWPRSGNTLSTFEDEVPLVLRNNLASRFRRIGGSDHRQFRKRAEFNSQFLVLEERCLMSVSPPIPIPSANKVVDLSTIFWNGETNPLNTAKGKTGIPSPAASGAMKTITLTNYSTSTIYPFLRSSNDGTDPNDSNKGYYDPQDLTHKEFREYVGYSTSTGGQFLGLPSGATIKFQVPLVLWDGDNISLVTDGTYLTASGNAPGSKIFNYNDDAKISIAGAAPVSNTVWVQGSANYPAGESALVMFYFANTAPATVPNDAPAQLAEVTFRDSYLKNFIDDAFQTFPLLNYDVSYVNTLVAPAAMEASNVPVTSGAIASGNLAYYYPNQDFGWHASDQSTTTFDPLIQNFVSNTGKAAIGQYFGGKGWPQYYNPNTSDYIIPSGANILDNSPLDATGAPSPVNVSNYDNNQWLLSSSGGGDIAATAGGAVLSNANATQLPLIFSDQDQRNQFIQDISSMEASKQTINLTLSTTAPNYQGVLGKFVKYNPSSSVNSYVVTSGGSHYSSKTYVKIVGGGGNGAKGDVHVVNGVITSIGLNPANAGSGYTSPPQVQIIDPSGAGSGALASATITGGTAVVQLAKGRTLPTGVGITYVFQRTGTDYASTDITNLWYSWADYYVNQFNSFVPEPANGTLVYQSIGSGSPVLTNQIALSALPKVPLAVGMSVMGTGVPAGTTILKIVGKTVYLSQIPDSDTPSSQQYTFSKPKNLAIDPISAKYTHPYVLRFNAANTPNAKLFGGSVYEAMQIQTVNLPAAAYLPTTMNVVDHVIKFYANIPTYMDDWGPTLVGEARDIVKSILRGVYDYIALPDQTQWYPNPAAKTGGQGFNVYNLDPYVWFVHDVEQLSGYGFSVDDDVANPSATGPRGDDTNHAPSDLQIGFSGIQGTGSTSNATKLGNQSEWFPTTKWGAIPTTATIGIQPDGPYKGYSVITLTGDNPLRTLNQIVTPGPGQIGAYISAPGFIVPGTTLIYFPNGVLSPQIILSQNAISTPTSIPVTIDAATIILPKASVANPSFQLPVQASAPFFTVNPKGPNVGWNFSGTAGIAGQGSTYTSNNPAPVGTQVGFIQNSGVIGQAVTLQANQAYAVSFLVSQRKLNNGSSNSQTLQVKIGNTVIGNFTPTQTIDGTYVQFTSNAFTVPTAGSYNITITGTNTNGGDNTALIDQVTVTGGQAAPQNAGATQQKK
jgi:hypothetical protein